MLDTEKSPRLNMELDKRVCILPEEYLWAPYRANGVLHMPLESEMAESGFVKKNQFHPDDKKYVVIKKEDRHWQQGLGNLKVLTLHSHQGENTALVLWPSNETFQTHQHHCGEEILVLKGMFCDEHGDYPAGTWIRSPHQSIHTPYVGLKETLILVKTGHLCT